MSISRTEWTPLDRQFDYRSTHDERSRLYAARDRLTPGPRRVRQWTPGMVLDQGREGACVGYGWTAELGASPIRVPDADDSLARSLYYRARQIDQWEGESYEGTSVLAGAGAAREAGYIDEYLWAFSIDDVIDSVVNLGPVVIGIPWYDWMYDTRPSGLVEVGGRIVGGHCLTLIGYHPGMRIKGEGWFRRHEVFKWQNSWSESYGKGGFGYIHVSELEELLNDNGEACVPVGRHR